MKRDTYFACVYCGQDVGSHEPATFLCCGECGHVEERDEETGEPVEDYQAAAIATAQSESAYAANERAYRV
jgi:transcription elongation factor Elf1